MVTLPWNGPGKGERPSLHEESCLDCHLRVCSTTETLLDSSRETRGTIGSAVFGPGSSRVVAERPWRLNPGNVVGQDETLVVLLSSGNCRSDDPYAVDQSILSGRDCGHPPWYGLWTKGTWPNLSPSGEGYVPDCLFVASRSRRVSPTIETPLEPSSLQLFDHRHHRRSLSV